MHGLYSSHKASPCFRLFHTSLLVVQPSQKLHVYSWQSVAMLAQLPEHGNETFLCSDEAALKTNQLSWTPLLSRAVSREKMKRPRSGLLKFRFVILLLIFIIPLRISNFTITWLLQTKLPCPLHLNHLLLQSMKSK